MVRFSATTASPFFLNCRAMTVSSGSDSIPSSWSVAPSAAVLTASLLPLVNTAALGATLQLDRKRTRLNSSHANISQAVICDKRKKNKPWWKRDVTVERDE